MRVKIFQVSMPSDPLQKWCLLYFSGLAMLNFETMHRQGILSSSSLYVQFPLIQETQNLAKLLYNDQANAASLHHQTPELSCRMPFQALCGFAVSITSIHRWRAIHIYVIPRNSYTHDSNLWNSMQNETVQHPASSKHWCSEHLSLRFSVTNQYKLFLSTSWPHQKLTTQARLKDRLERSWGGGGK